MLPCLRAHATFVTDAKFAFETQKMFLNFFRNILRPQQMFPRLFATETLRYLLKNSKTFTQIHVYSHLKAFPERQIIFLHLLFAESNTYYGNRVTQCIRFKSKNGQTLIDPYSNNLPYEIIFLNDHFMTLEAIPSFKALFD